ncbi:hypothetical protein [Saccharopolyspora sp. 7B]|uniref:hypothetical protein n=1 Tax=Saccharopolyspora sp. 7B TaxID=2877240 RepID=UPI001CD35350|nr:hypothetical protein [Saccharopolyspora sp. 7B]MCA1280233.1 hypothetical protein [Saccharopolyspora sp. 7B]
MRPKSFLPMTWCYEPVGGGHTFRWGRGSGVITVHRGDVRGSHGDEALVDTVRVGRDWVDDRDLRVEARRWLRAEQQRLRRAAAQPTEQDR